MATAAVAPVARSTRQFQPALPGVKPGLANIVTLVVLIRHGWATAVWASGFARARRQPAARLLSCPGFLALTGTTFSLLTLGLARHLPGRWFGPVSPEHPRRLRPHRRPVAARPPVADPAQRRFLLTPVFAAAALVFGTINGLIAAGTGWRKSRPGNLSMNKTICPALTGASGMPHGLRLLECLLAAGCRVQFLYSQAAQVVARQEIDLELPSRPAEARAALLARYPAVDRKTGGFRPRGMVRPGRLGSNPPDAMVVCPCSMGTLAAIAQGWPTT